MTSQRYKLGLGNGATRRLMARYCQADAALRLGGKPVRCGRRRTSAGSLMARPGGEVSALFEHMCEKYPERDAGVYAGVG